MGWPSMRRSNVDSRKHLISNSPTDYSVRELCIGEQITQNASPQLSTVKSKVVQGQKFMRRLGNSEGGDMFSARPTWITGFNHHVLNCCQRWPINILPFRVSSDRDVPLTRQANIFPTQPRSFNVDDLWHMCLVSSQRRSKHPKWELIIQWDWKAWTSLGPQCGAVLGFQDYLSRIHWLKHFSHLIPLIATASGFGRGDDGGTAPVCPWAYWPRAGHPGLPCACWAATWILSVWALDTCCQEVFPLSGSGGLLHQVCLRQEIEPTLPKETHGLDFIHGAASQMRRVFTIGPIRRVGPLQPGVDGTISNGPMIPPFPAWEEQDNISVLKGTGPKLNVHRSAHYWSQPKVRPQRLFANCAHHRGG